ncbi:MAG: 1-acyl-sn-glycerol-3-phosphate acyltransferase [Gammaproteobacteria bacterium]|nr:1-acyl-sn-glycerol-3-phosphate acyltransferase [Gammaproteobacteria bacterium]MCW8986332.1 1-acyl-sn-glycerol-3-phosphate acyltransferase [Gammaproteobacteria bacterium]
MNKLSQLFNFLNASYRLLWLGLHFIYGLNLLLVYRFRWGKQWFYTQQGARSIQKWFRQGSRILGLKIQMSGAVNSGSTMLVSNHISWLDIVAIAASTPVTFVSKLDLKSWPMIGVLAKSSGTVFIKRGSLFSMHQTISNLIDVLNSGRKTIFFPEGTTTTGVGVKKFNSGLFETAHRVGTPVQPVAISYFRNGEPDRDVAPYVDDDHFMLHLWTLLYRGKLELELDFLDEILPEKHSRRELAHLCQSRISEVIETSAMIHTDYPLSVDERALFSYS